MLENTMARKDFTNFPWQPAKPQRSFYMNMLILIARGAAVAGFLLLVYVVYGQALLQLLDTAGVVVAFIVTWIFTAYVVLPRVHRFLTGLYLPDYYIGRTRNAAGLLSDPINMAVIGSEEQLRRAMAVAGWREADPVSPRTLFKTVQSIILKRSYLTAPVSSLELFGRKQDLAFQIEVNNNPRARHHVRFWRTPSKWYLPGGYKADLLGAATYDKKVGFSLFTGQLDHKIAENIDDERDFVINTLQQTPQIKDISVVSEFTTAYHHRNGGGDSIVTDGAMPFIHLG